MSINGEFLAYLKKIPAFQFEEAAKALGIDVIDVCNLIIDNWYKVKGQLINGQWCTQVTQEVWYTERVLDNKHYRGHTAETKLSDVLNLTRSSPLWSRFMNHKDSHHSVFLHTEAWHVNARKTKSVSHQNIGDLSLTLPILWIELDRENHEKACRDTNEIVANLDPAHYEVFFSGNKSPHIAINAGLFGFPRGKAQAMAGNGRFVYNLAMELCGDVRWRNGVATTFTLTKQEVDEELRKLNLEKKQDLENFDPGIYHANALIRAPYSIHEKTGIAKGVYKHSELQDCRKPNKLRYSEKVFDSNVPPLLLYSAYKSLKPLKPGIKRQLFKELPAALGSTVFEVYKQLFGDDFDPSKAGGSGWIGGLKNPFYEDSRPSVSVNIKDGRFHDWGDEDYQLSFIQLYALLLNITEKQAEHRLSALEIL